MSKCIVRRTVDYGGDRKASSYLIEGSTGYRFAKCGTTVATKLDLTSAKRIVHNLRRRKSEYDASYAVVEI